MSKKFAIDILTSFDPKVAIKKSLGVDMLHSSTYEKFSGANNLAGFSIMDSERLSGILGGNKFPINPLEQLQQSYALKAFKDSLFSKITSPEFIPHYNAFLQKMLEVDSEFTIETFDLFDIDLLPYKDVETDEVDETKSKIIIDESSRLVSLIQDIRKDNENLFKIKPREFEEVIAELLRHKGFEVHLTKETRDGGYDILAVQSLSGFKTKYLVECKRQSRKNPVQIEAIRSFLYVIQREKANRGIFCTTSRFTTVVKDEQELVPHILDLRDNMDIVSWINDYKSGLIL